MTTLKSTAPTVAPTVKTGKWDINIFFTALALTCFGVVMIFSASMYASTVEIGNEYFYFKKQLSAAIVGVVLMIVLSQVDYHYYRKFAFAGVIIAIVLLCLCFVPGIFVEVNNAKRWIKLGPLPQFQPSEIAKLAVILFMAHSIDKKGNDITSFARGIIPYLLLAGIVAGLIVIEPNLSTAILIVAIIVGMMFIGGVNLKYMLVLGVAVIVGAVVMMTIVDWRMGRVNAWLDPWAYRLDEGWQILQSLMALGAGGIFGQGLGNGKQKLLFMPEAENDYILAHIGEELGLIGTLLVLLAFVYLMLRGIRTAINVQDRFGSLLASGIMIMIGMQVMINVGVVTNTIPSTGIPLPFLSYGGTSLVINLVAMGVLLNISKHANAP